MSKIKTHTILTPQCPPELFRDNSVSGRMQYRTTSTVGAPYTQVYAAHQNTFSTGLSYLRASISALITRYAGGCSAFPSTGAELSPQTDLWVPCDQPQLPTAQHLVAPAPNPPAYSGTASVLR